MIKLCHDRDDLQVSLFLTVLRDTYLHVTANEHRLTQGESLAFCCCWRDSGVSLSRPNFSCPWATTPYLLYSSCSTNHFPQGFIQLKTGWAKDAWPQWLYESWYFHLDISHWLKHNSFMLLFFDVGNIVISACTLSVAAHHECVRTQAIHLHYGPSLWRVELAWPFE